MNPMQLLQNFITKGLSPQKIVEQMVNSNPMMANLIKMANSGDTRGVENFARNMFKEKGRDFDKEFSEFRKNFK
jgi:hypothetical protein